MDLSDLLIFSAVVRGRRRDARGGAAASRTVPMSRPASGQLEEDLAVPLFIREGKRFISRRPARCCSATRSAFSRSPMKPAARSGTQTARTFGLGAMERHGGRPVAGGCSAKLPPAHPGVLLELRSGNPQVLGPRSWRAISMPHWFA